MIHYRKPNKAENSYYRSIDLHCHEQPSPADWWAEIFENEKACGLIACEDNLPIGMLIAEWVALKLPEHPQKVTSIHMHKLCVNKEFRGQGIGQRLLAEAHEEARKNGCPYITVTVPAYNCLPETAPDDDVSQWLGAFDFKAVMTLPTQISYMGKDWDQYLFAFKVRM